MKDFNSKLTQFFTGIDEKFVRHVPNLIAETAVEYFKESFQNKSFDGKPWKPYKNRSREPRRGSLLRRSSNLINTIRPTEVTPTTVRINAGSSRVPYAKVHNEGLRIKGTRSIGRYTNNNFMGKGKAVQIKAHTRRVDYKMPKRQFMGKSKELYNRITTRFQNAFGSR